MVSPGLRGATRASSVVLGLELRGLPGAPEDSGKCEGTV